MKIICTYLTRKLVNKYIDNINSETTISINVNNRKLSHCEFAYESIVDIDEENYLLFKIITGKNLPILESSEYAQLMLDGSIFLSKKTFKEILLLDYDFSSL